MSKPPLNAEQAIVAEQLFKFLLNPDQKECILSGPGGVGKSFLIGHLQDELLPRLDQLCALEGRKCPYDQVVLTATTNKAAEALSEASGLACTTIHSALKLRLSQNEQTGKETIKRTPQTVPLEHVILVVDEASMDSKELDRYIQDLTYQCKIIYVCDDKQLPPVGEKLSVIFGRGMPQFNLTVPMRTSIPELQALNQQLRETITHDTFMPILLTPGRIDWLPKEAMGAELRSHFMDPNHRNRILAWSNNKVNELNAFVRSMRGLPPSLQIGENLVANTAFKHGLMTIGVETPLEILEINDEVEEQGLPGGGVIQYQRMDLDSPYHGQLNNVKVPTSFNHWRALRKHYADKADWRTYFMLAEVFPELRPTDASTIHKSQGSSYDTVFVDLTDLSRCTHKDVTARLMYVAFSRARHRVVLFGQLAEKYGSIVR